MPFKMLCWNMEWMNDLFDGEGNFRSDDTQPQHDKKTTVKGCRNDLAGVINEISPTVVIVVEGPNHTKELQLFLILISRGTGKRISRQPKVLPNVSVLP